MNQRVVWMAALCLGMWLTVALTPAVADRGEQELATGWDLLKQQKYPEARAALEAGLQKNQSNALAHFYLAEACRGLKAWACAEEHYETSLELEEQSSVAGLAKPRLRKAKVWRLLEEAKRTIDDSQAPPEKIKQAGETLDIANKLGLDDEQQAVSQQLQEKMHKGSSTGSAQPSATPGALTAGAGQDKDGAPMVMVPAGEFIMGSQTGEPDEQPAHRVYLDAYSIDTYEVTVGQYAKFLAGTGLEAPPDWNIMNQPQHQKRPVVNVDWADAGTYCRWAGKQLPTEAEWEKAARGTDGRTYPWGNDSPTRLHANFGKFNKDESDFGWHNHAALNPVGLLEDGKSPYGIYDLAGNVWEWTADWYAEDYYRNSPLQNPKGPASGAKKVLRGGSWVNDPGYLRSAYRGHTVRRRTGTTTAGSGVRRLRSPWFLSPWSLVFF